MSIVRFPRVEPVGRGVWSELELVGNAKTQRSPTTGVTRTVSRSGDHWRMRLRYENVTAATRDRIRAAIAGLKGRAGRVYLEDFSYEQRGSFTQSQVVTEPDFDNDGAGWSFADSEFADVDVVDEQLIARVRQRWRDITFASETVSGLAVGVPYLCRALFRKQSPTDSLRPEMSIGQSAALAEWVKASGEDNSVFSPSRILGAFVPHALTDPRFSLVYRVVSGVTEYGHAIAADHASVARCALIDVPENLALFSENFDNAAWTKARLSVNADAANFGGISIADTLVEDGTASDAHYVRQTITKTSAQELATISVFARRNTAQANRNIQLRLSNSTDTDRVRADFDLGAGTVSNIVDASSTFKHARATIEALPNIGETQWYRCTLSGVTSTDTSLFFYVFLSEPGTGIIYDGDSASGVHLFGAQFQFSALAGHYVKTTSAAVQASAASNPGNLIPLKGLPASTDGLLLPGDMVEAIPAPAPVNSERSQLARVESPLNSDEGGRGFLHISPGLRVAPDISARFWDDGNQVGIRSEPCVALWRPQGRFMLAADSVVEAWTAEDTVTVELVFEEDIAA